MPILSAAFPRKIIVIPANPGLSPSISEEASPILPGIRSCDILMHTGWVDIIKKPHAINSMIESMPPVLNVKKNSGIDSTMAVWIIMFPFLKRS